MARMSPLQVCRLVALFLVIFFSSVTLGVLAHLSTERPAEPRVLLTVVVAALSVLTISTMVLIDMLRRKITFLSFIVSEIIWLGALSAAWLAAAISLPRMTRASCGLPDCEPQVEISRVFALLSFAILLIYTIVLYIKTARLRRSSDRPAHVWTGSVRDVFAPGWGPHITLMYRPPTPSKTGFGFVVEQDDDPFHSEPPSSRVPSMLSPRSPHSPSPLLASSPRSVNESFLSPSSPVFVVLPGSLPPVHLQV